MKCHSSKRFKLLESFKKAKLKYLVIQIQSDLRYNKFNQRRCDLATDIIFAKIHKKVEHCIQKTIGFINLKALSI